MTVEIPVSDETAEIIQRLIGKGRYPDSETALAEGLRLLDEARHPEGPPDRAPGV